MTDKHYGLEESTNPRARSINFWFAYTEGEDGPVLYAGPPSSNPDQWAWVVWIKDGKMFFKGHLDGILVDKTLCMYTMVRCGPFTTGTLVYKNDKLVGRDETPVITVASPVHQGRWQVDELKFFDRELDIIEVTDLFKGRESSRPALTSEFIHIDAAQKFISNSFVSRQPFFAASGSSSGPKGAESTSRLVIRGYNPVASHFSRFSDIVPPGSWSGSSPLFLFAGNTRCEVMNMFIKSSTVPKMSGFNTLALRGSNANEMYKAVPLRIVGYALSSHMNLVIQGKDTGGTSKLINMTITGGNPDVDGHATLFVHNDSNFYDDVTTSLFVKGLGLNPGFSPSSHSVNLYIKRGPNAGITLFMCNNNMTSSTPLHIIGAPNQTASSKLFVKGFGGTLTSNTNLEITGNVFTANQATSTLVVPNVIGFEPDIAFLYTNGF